MKRDQKYLAHDLARKFQHEPTSVAILSKDLPTVEETEIGRKSALEANICRVFFTV